MSRFGVLCNTVKKGRRWRSRRRNGRHDRREARQATWTPGGRVRINATELRSGAEVKYLTGRLLRANQEND
jgi:hypothetical protein